MKEDTLIRLANCEAVLVNLELAAPEPEVIASIRNTRTVVCALLQEPELKDDEYCEYVIQEVMQRIKELQSEIAGAPTLRATGLPFNSLTQKT